MTTFDSNTNSFTLDPIIVTGDPIDPILSLDPGEWDQPGSPGIGGIETGMGTLTPTDPIFSSGSFANGLDYRTWNTDNAPSASDLGLNDEELAGLKKWLNSNKFMKDPQKWLGPATDVYIGTGGKHNKPVQEWLHPLLDDPQSLQKYISKHDEFRPQFADAGTIGLYFNLEPQQQERFLASLGEADGRQYKSIYDYIMHAPGRAQNSGFVAHDYSPAVISEQEFSSARPQLDSDLVNQEPVSGYRSPVFHGAIPIPEGGPLKMNLPPRQQIWEDYKEFTANPHYNMAENAVKVGTNVGINLLTGGVLGQGNMMLGVADKASKAMGGSGLPSSYGDLIARDMYAKRQSRDSEAERLSKDPLMQIEFGAIPGNRVLNDIADFGVSTALSSGSSLGRNPAEVAKSIDDTRAVNTASMRPTDQAIAIGQKAMDAYNSNLNRYKTMQNYQKWAEYQAKEKENKKGPDEQFSSIDFTLNSMPLSIDLSTPGYSGPTLRSPGIGGI